MRIAVPVWEDKVSPVLDTTSRLLIYEVKDSRTESCYEACLDEQAFPRRCLRIQNMGIDVLICGAVSSPFLRMLMASGIKIIDGISGNPKDVIAAYFEGTLDHTRFLMPGFKRKRFGQRDDFSDCKKFCEIQKRRKEHQRKKMIETGVFLRRREQKDRE